MIKRQWGFYYITTKKGIQHSSADVDLMFTAYNLGRLINIIDKKSAQVVPERTYVCIF
ncbi:MAG: hypothetical protein WKG06_08970 [Segetibacter sp.]